jgi:hypothetical protein
MEEPMKTPKKLSLHKNTTKHLKLKTKLKAGVVAYSVDNPKACANNAGD